MDIDVLDRTAVERHLERVFARVSVEAATATDARRCDLSLQFFRQPSLCAFRNNRFHLNRSTSHVPFVCREVVTEDNVFDHSGETLTHCALDAEDGWEGLHDFYLRRNRFVNIPNASIILNAGQNLVVDENVGSIAVRERVVSPCVRSNVCTTAIFLCGRPGTGSAGHEHTMHGRYLDNVFSRRLTLGGGCVELADCTLENTTSRFQYWAAPVRIDMTGCTVKGTNSLWNVGSYAIGRYRFADTTFDCGAVDFS